MIFFLSACATTSKTKINNTRQTTNDKQPTNNDDQFPLKTIILVGLLGTLGCIGGYYLDKGDEADYNGGGSGDGDSAGGAGAGGIFFILGGLLGGLLGLGADTVTTPKSSDENKDVNKDINKDMSINNDQQGIM